MTAPTSPKDNSMEFYYSAPASPQWKGHKTTDDNPRSNLDEFEFETSKRFSVHLHSKSAVAFADELFLNGLVMPLKLPPRLQTQTTDFNSSHKSPVASPRTTCRIPFARTSSWHDDYDPFMVALEKVREDKRGRNSLHSRRSRSFSPFRATSKADNPMKLAAQSYSGPLDFKGLVYARWVRDQTRHGQSPKGFLFKQRVRPLIIEHDGSDKYVRKKGGESKVQKLKGFLLRYASFGTGSKKSSEPRKQGYFGQSIFKFKGRNSKRMMAA